MFIPVNKELTDSIITQSDVKTELKEQLKEHLKVLRAERNPYGNEFSRTLKAEIRHRDRYMCRKCHKTETELGRELDCHHIDYQKKNLAQENLISLCRKCHTKTNTHRGHWQKLFTEKNRRYYVDSPNCPE